MESICKPPPLINFYLNALGNCQQKLAENLLMFQNMLLKMMTVCVSEEHRFCSLLNPTKLSIWLRRMWSQLFTPCYPLSLLISKFNGNMYVCTCRKSPKKASTRVSSLLWKVVNTLWVTSRHWRLSARERQSWWSSQTTLPNWGIVKTSQILA